MKLLFQLIKKELRLMFRDKIAVVVQLILPVVTLALTDQALNTDLRQVKVAAVVPVQTESATNYLKPLLYNELFSFQGIISSVEEGMTMLRKSRIHALVVLDGDFDRNMAVGNCDGVPSVQIITDNSNTVVGNAATYYITSALDQSSGDYISMQAMFNPGFRSIYHYGISIFALALVLMITHRAAISMVGERTRHSIDNVIMSSVSTKMLMLSKLLTYLIFYSLDAVICFLAVRYILNVPFNGSLLLFAIITEMLIITSLFLGFFISLCSATESNASGTTVSVVCLLLMFFSGFIFPADSMPLWAQLIGDAFYTKWYIDAAHKVYLQGTGIDYIVKNLLFMSMSTVTFMLMCFYKLNKERWLR
ncbi:MAG: ABC transporter permease [Bacteroidaceae bacterium]|nr:ABC transporter permease [Bacteroidaceae bacterium]